MTGITGRNSDSVRLSRYNGAMNKNAEQLLAEALRVAKLNGSFFPATIGAKIGLTKAESEVAARNLSNAGILVLGFDCSANFSPDYRKMHAPARPGLDKKKRRTRPAMAAGAR
jgi:hypothetical protein